MTNNKEQEKHSPENPPCGEPSCTVCNTPPVATEVVECPMCEGKGDIEQRPIIKAIDEKKASEIFENYETSVFKQVTTPPSSNAQENTKDSETPKSVEESNWQSELYKIWKQAVMQKHHVGYSRFASLVEKAITTHTQQQIQEDIERMEGMKIKNVTEPNWNEGYNTALNDLITYKKDQLTK